MTSRKTSNPSLPTLLTPETIALIERNASARYGIRLKHIPLEDEQDEPAKPSKSTARAPSKPPTKPSKAPGEESPDEARLSKQGHRGGPRRAGLQAVEGKPTTLTEPDEVGILADLKAGPKKAGQLADRFPEGWSSDRRGTYLGRLAKAGKIAKEGQAAGATYSLVE